VLTPEQEATVERFAYAKNVSLPTAEAVLELRARLQREHGAAGLDDRCAEEAIAALVRGEAWAQEFVSVIVDRKFAECEQVVETAQAVGGEPGVALAAMDGMTERAAAVYLDIHSEAARRMEDRGPGGPAS
jgi:hypothetical protein